MEMRTTEEDLDTFREEGRENNYDIDQGKNVCPAEWASLCEARHTPQEEQASPSSTALSSGQGKGHE